jgi:hypothetical protein
MSRRTPPKTKTLAPAKQRRLDALLEKNAAGKITAKESQTLRALVDEAEQLMVDNSQRLADFARSESPQAPSAAVPVTVWVSPQPAEH